MAARAAIGFALAVAVLAGLGTAATAMGAPETTATTASPSLALPGHAPLGEHPRIPSQPEHSSTTLFVDGATSSTANGTRSDQKLLDEGHALYAVHCSSCHGADLNGVAARATSLSSNSTGGPSLADDGGSGVDFYLKTGRMPLAVTSTQAVHDDPHFDPRQIAAIETYVDSRTHVVPIADVRVDAALLQHGRLLFEDNCQSCHGAGAEGATAGYQWIALPLDKATPVEIGEAIRIGPGVMPRWNDRQFSASDVDAIATYVRYTIETPQDYGGSTLAYLGPVAEGLIGAILGVGSLFWIIYFTGTKADGTRLS